MTDEPEQTAIVEAEPEAAERSERWRLSLPQCRAVQLVFMGTMQSKEIAAACGVCRETLWRWKRLPEFQDALAELADEALGEAIMLLKSKAKLVVARMLSALKDDGARGDKAAESLMRFLWGDPARAQVLINQSNEGGQAILTSADLEKLTGEIDGDHAE